MKKVLFGFLAIMLLSVSVSAQEKGKDALKEARKMSEKYSSNSIENADMVPQIMAYVETAFESEEVQQPKYFNEKGEVYSNVIKGQINQKLLVPDAKVNNPDAALMAMEAYKQGLNMALEMDKKGERKDALQGLDEVESHLNNLGIFMWQDQKYGEAFDYFNASLMIYDVLKENDKETRLDDEATRTDHMFYTAAAGYYGQRGEAVVPVLKKMDAMGTDQGLIYEALYNILSKTNMEEALGYLNKGRELFPDDTGLLFAEINHYLQSGQLEVLIDKLKMAIEKEPDNVSVYTTLGNVYDQLNQSERGNGNVEKADEYFGEAMNYYTQALEIDPNNFDAKYSQGALYYNKAASLTDDINALADDFSAEGTKKYNALKEEMVGYFDQALPFFLDAEKMADDAGTPDLNVLIALKEIYARKDMLDKSKEYKTKMEGLQGGE